MSFWVAGAEIVVGVGGAAYGASQSKKAAGVAAKGGDAAIAEQRREYDQTRADYAPQRAIGQQATNALGAIYGYSPTYGSDGPAAPSNTLFTPARIQNSVPGGSLNLGGQLTQKLGGLGKVLDPAASLFGSTHGDEKRNLKAFMAANPVYDLGNGKLALQDGTQFNSGDLQKIAGTWYGATYAPDGNQSDWQQKYQTLIGGLPKAQTGQTGAAGTAGQPTNALTSPDYSNFYKSPDYQFRKDQGTQGVERSAAARGGAYSGNALKALAEFNSNLAAGEFGNYFNRQATLAGIGQSATNSTTQAGLITSNNISNATQNAADARASGVAGSANAWGNALSGIASGVGYYYGNRKPPVGQNYWTGG